MSESAHSSSGEDSPTTDTEVTSTDVQNSIAEEKPEDADDILDEFSDVILRVEGRDIKAVKVVLSMVSPVFKAMFGSNFKEREQDTIDIHERKYDDFKEFLACINPHKQKAVTADNVYTILPLVDEYQVETLRSKCHDVLMQQVDETTSAADVFHHLYLCETYNLGPQLKTRCCYLASEFKLSQILESEAENKISAVSRTDIRNLALARSDLREGDEEYIINIMRSQNSEQLFFAYLRKKLFEQNDVFLPAKVHSKPSHRKPALRNMSFSQPVAPTAFSFSQPAATAGTGLFGLPAFTACPSINTHVKPLCDDFLIMRIAYRYFADDKELIECCVRNIRKRLGTLSAEDQKNFDLLPEYFKHIIRGKTTWTIP